MVEGVLATPILRQWGLFLLSMQGLFTQGILISLWSHVQLRIDYFESDSVTIYHLHVQSPTFSWPIL